MSLFSRKPRRQVGIDIGTSSLKVIELSRSGSHLKLENYGIISGLDFFTGGSVPSIPSTLKLSESEIANGLLKLLELSNIKTKEAVFSIPVFSSFLTVMELPTMKMEELQKAVPFEARSYIPVPLSEVVIDWLAIPPRTKNPTLQKSAPGAANNSQATQASQEKATDTISILLIAVPKEVISKYQRIIRAAQLTLRSLEAESFSMIRSLLGNDLAPTMVVDFGARSTTLTIVDQGFVRMNHSLDLSGKEITNTIARGLSVSPERAEELKKSSGIALSQNGDSHGISQLVRPLLNRLTLEFEKMSSSYTRQEGQNIGKIILTGGSARLPGLPEILKGELKTEVVVGNPFARIEHPKELESVLKNDLATSCAVAVGSAMRDL